MVIGAIKFTDKYFGSVICRLLALFKSGKTPNLETPKKILIIQLWGIGETILTLPALDALSKKYPNSEITLLATKRNQDVYHNKGFKIITLNLNPFSIINFTLRNYKKYDLVADMEEYLNVSSIISFFVGKYNVGFSHGARAKLYSKKAVYNDRQHCAQAFLDLARALGISCNSSALSKLNFDAEDETFVNDFLNKNNVKKNDFLIGIAPGAAESAKSRMWPLENYIKLIGELIKKPNAKVILIGSENEKILSAEIIQKLNGKNSRIVDSIGKLSLKQLFCLMEKLNLFIGNDAGAMHMAAAQGAKTIGLFGPNLPVRFAPYGKGNIAVYKGKICEFSPCINVHKGEVPDCLYSKNSEDYQKCMKNIKVRDVLKEISWVI